MYALNAPGERQKSLVWLGAILLALGIQFSILVAPQIAWMLIGLVGAVVLLNCPPYMWVVITVFFAVGSRLLVAMGVAPQMVNFLHFPFAFGGALLSAVNTTSSRGSADVRRLGLGMVGLLFLSVASWAVNGGDLLKPFLTWLVLCEPFLLMLVLLKHGGDARASKRLWGIALLAVSIQVPIGLWQVARYGLGDSVAGSFVGTASGAHIAGAVALTGALVLLAKFLFRSNIVGASNYLIGFLVLMIVPVVADAKSVLGVFMIGGIILVLLSKEVGVGKIIGTVLLSIVVMYIAVQYHQSVARILEKRSLETVTDRKMIALTVFARHAHDAPYAWLLGFGPGNTFSRVALLSSGGLARPDSPVASLKLFPSDITKETIKISFQAAYAPEGTSSAWQIWSSWAGVLGDLGVMGLGLYGWLWWIIWHHTRDAAGWPQHGARALIATTVLLGLTYSWLEEPGFILVAALFIALCVSEGKNLARTGRS